MTVAKAEPIILLKFYDGTYRHYEYLAWLMLHNVAISPFSTVAMKNNDSILKMEVTIKKRTTDIVLAIEQILSRTNWRIVNESTETLTTIYLCERF